MRDRSLGFTIIELLVVVAIIVMLLAILLPSMNRAVGIAQDAQCRSQQHQIMYGFLMFTGDHSGTLPGGTFWNWVVADDVSTWAWYGAEVHPDITARLGWGSTGTLAPYLGVDSPPGATVPTDHTKGLMRCPSLPQAGLGTGLGSNGMFDYSAFLAFAGAKLATLPTTVQMRDPQTGLMSNVRTPLLVEEDPARHKQSHQYRDGTRPHRCDGTLPRRSGHKHRLDRRKRRSLPVSRRWPQHVRLVRQSAERRDRESLGGADLCLELRRMESPVIPPDAADPHHHE